MSARFYLSLLAVVCACLLALALLSPKGTSAAAPRASNETFGASNAGAARRALADGTALFRRNRADLALPLLESALRLFTEANDQNGLAAASDALGDIYLRHGQYATAGEHFRRAAEAFRARGETANAALMFAKLGEAYYLAGDEPAARAAFARIGEGGKNNDGAGAGLSAGAGRGGGGGRNNSGAGGSATFAAVSALLPGLASCPSSPPATNPNNVAQTLAGAANNVAGILTPGGNAPPNTVNNPPRNLPGNTTNNPAGRSPGGRQPGKPTGNSAGNSLRNPASNPSGSSSGNSAGRPSGNQPGNPSNNPNGNSANNPANNSPNNSANNEPPNMGRAPKTLDGIGRMDLRVMDDQGNPIRGAKGRLSTTRPNGIFCDCWEETNEAGRALLPPIHVGKELKLEVNAPGYEPLEQVVPGERLAEPFKVILKAKNAANSAPRGSGQKLAHAVMRRPPQVPNNPPRSSEEIDTASAGQPHEDASGAEHALKAEPAASPDSPSACFDLYRLFIAYATRELRLARADFEGNRAASAQAHYRNVLAAADTNAPTGNLAAARLFRAVARTSLGDIALRQSRFKEAVEFYEQAAYIARRDGRPELTWGAERGLGKAYWVMANGAGDAQSEAKYRNAALNHYRSAIAVIETLFAGSLRADNARSNFLAATRDVFEEAAGVLAELVLMNAPPATPRRQASSAHAPDAADARPLEGQSLAYAAEAFGIVEQGKARSLLDMLGEARAEVREGVPAALVEQKASNTARQQEIASLLGGVSLQGDVPKRTITELEAELERLAVEFDSLENRIRTSSPRYAALVRAEPLTLAEVQKQVLDDATVLLEYSLGAHQSYLFAATRDGLTLHRLPSRERIERQAIELRQKLIPAGVRRAIAGINVENTRGLTLGSPSTAGANVAAYASAAHALYRTIIAPAAASLGGRRVLVVPEGALNYVPFESLVTTTEGSDYSALSYLVRTNEIVYAPSASVIAEVRRQARRVAAVRGGMLVVADPVFDAGDLRFRSSPQGAAVRSRESAQRLSLASALADVTNVRNNNLKLVRLDGTRSEAEEIARLARASGGQADVWLDLDANEANLHARRLDGYRVLHFATHGLLDAERPQFTGLALSLVGQAEADGFLRVDEVFNLRLGSPLVMLSACETGLGRERRGEGVIGLTRAFMYAGAPTVGVSLWSVGDKSTAELMPEFYRRLLAGRTGAPAAMRASQLAMIAGKRYSAPFYWSPFIIVGDWREQ
ncbi:MAG TPA: CHAT domain-containing tetratricopeptide repeat protein [Pyrinomonadaceae bacterium]|nr:CHAT domain-containing tetratricopeptide repeat protein [Pyrinomonadaceae bacterium]